METAQQSDWSARASPSFRAEFGRLTRNAALDLHVGEILEMDGRHGAQVAVGHVERVVDFLGVAADEASSRLSDIVKQVALVDRVELARLRRDVRGGPDETTEDVAKLPDVGLLSDDVAVPLSIELQAPSALGLASEATCRLPRRP